MSMDSSILNSTYAVELLQPAQRASPSGVRIFGGRCPVVGCLNFCALGQAFCPVHRSDVSWLDKTLINYCPNCFDIFILWTIKHHCHACGKVFCGDCADYQLAETAPMPLKKAVVHHNLFATLTGQNYDRRVCIQCASLLHPNIARKIIVNPLHAMYRHSPIDVVFCFDATASMTSHIENVEENIDDIVSDIHRHHYVDLRVGAVAYRDHAYGTRIANVIPFQNHHKKFERMVDHIRAFSASGNDVPEALAVGLGIVQSLSWRPYACRLLIVITDAPPHGLAGQVSSDNYPDGDPSGLDPPSVIAQLAQDGVVTYTIGVEPEVSGNGGAVALKLLASVGHGLYLPLQPHHYLHHFVAAAACDLLMQVVCMEELRAAQAAEAATGTVVSPQARATATSRVMSRLRALTVPQFNFTPSTTASTTAKAANPFVSSGYTVSADAPVQQDVTGVHREPVTANTISLFLDRAVANNVTGADIPTATTTTQPNVDTTAAPAAAVTTS